MKSFVSTLLHLLELAVCAGLALAIAYLAHDLFNIDMSAPLVILLGFVFDGIAKYTRASPSNSVPDYVNKPSKEG